VWLAGYHQPSLPFPFALIIQAILQPRVYEPLLIVYVALGGWLHHRSSREETRNQKTTQGRYSSKTHFLIILRSNAYCKCDTSHYHIQHFQKLTLSSKHQVHTLHDRILIRIVRLVLGRNLKNRGNSFAVVSQQMTNVIGNLLKMSRGKYSASMQLTC
jgi:hypothetical protein